MAPCTATTMLQATPKMQLVGCWMGDVLIVMSSTPLVPRAAYWYDVVDGYVPAGGRM